MMEGLEKGNKRVRISQQEREMEPTLIRKYFCMNCFLAFTFGKLFGHCLSAASWQDSNSKQNSFVLNFVLLGEELVLGS